MDKAAFIQFDAIVATLRPPLLSYCDYIASRINDALSITDDECLLKSIGPVRWDLHPQHGYMLSTKKTFDCVDRNDTKYRVTVERVDEIPPATNPDELDNGLDMRQIR